MRDEIPADAYSACTEAAKQSYYTCCSLRKFTEDARDEYLEALKNPGSKLSEKQANILKDVVRQQGLELRGLAEREAFLKKRLEHAIKCLKRKGLHAGQIEDLQNICEDRQLLHERAVLQVLTCTIHAPLLGINSTAPLDEACWKMGIDITMLENEPGLAMSDSFYGPVLERNLCSIYANTVMAAFSAKTGLLLHDEDYKQSITDALAEQYTKSKEFDELVQEKVAEEAKGIILAIHSTLLPDAVLPKEDPKQAQKDIDKAVAKALAPVQSQLERLQQENQDLKSELKTLKPENESLFKALENRDRLISEYASKQSYEDLPELPDAGIIFAGGHPNMAKKIAQMHPGWTFIDGRDVNFPEFKDPLAVFFWDKHISHPTFWRVRNYTPLDTPQLYVKNTNLDMLEDEMRRAWASVRHEP